MTGEHQDANAFRASLDQRIRNASRESGTPHDRLRKDVAFHRLLARFVAVDDERWALKGGVALLWRVAADARATRDTRQGLKEAQEMADEALRQAIEEGRKHNVSMRDIAAMTEVSYQRVAQIASSS